MAKLKLKVRQVRDVQKRHGIVNLLAMKPEDAEKLLTVDALVDIYHEASRHFEDPPTVDAIEEMEVTDIVKDVLEIFQPPAK